MKTTLTYSIPALSPYMDWQYFSHMWKVPLPDMPSWSSATTEAKEEGQRLWQEATTLLQQLKGQNYSVRFRIALFDAYSENEDIIVTDDEGHRHLIPFLRQQHNISPNQPNLCLSDFIRPAATGSTDNIGIFAAAVDPSMEQENLSDSYLHLLTLSLCNMLVEAATEKGHEQVRKHLWGYAADENLSPAQLKASQYTGIRPAIGYPSIPDQSINFIVDRLIDMESIGIQLTNHGAMTPKASVSGFLFAHPKSRYFSVGKITAQQLHDYAQRRGWSVEQIKPYLAANLS